MKILFLTESIERRSGGLGVGALQSAISLSKAFSDYKHQLISMQQKNDERIEKDYSLPPNLTIIRVKSFGLKIYPISTKLFHLINE